MSQRIDWDHDGQRLLLRILVFPPRPLALNSLSAIALVDTGSTTTGVTRELAESLKLPQRGKRPMGGIGGDLQVQRYVFRVGLVPSQGGFPFIFDDLNGFELRDGFAFQVIIGMDLLSRCDLTVMRNGTATLEFGG